MPPKLSQAQQDIAKHLLRHNTLHITVANTIKCSVAKVRQMSSNLLKFGMLYKPKSRPRGRPRAITPAAVQVCLHSTVFVVKKKLILKGVREYLAGYPDAYRRDIVDFLWDDFDILVEVDYVSKMLQRERISRKKVT